MQHKLHDFAEKIMSIESPNIDVFGRPVPGMASGSAATQGAMTSGSDVTYQLKLKTTDFIKAQNEDDADTSKRLAEDIEGLLLTEVTLSVLNQKQVDSLVNMLHDITEGK